VVVLGRKDRKKIDPNTLVGKIVRVKALAGEEILILAVQENTGRLIGESQGDKGKKLVTVDDIE
jgi:hypothetical protein